MRRLLIVALGVAAAFMISVVAASASTPAAFQFDVQDSGTIKCSTFNPAWHFRDNYVDAFQVDGMYYFDADGNVVREVWHVTQTSNDVNSATGFAISEHNNYLLTFDYVAGTITLDGAISNAERRGAGIVIQRAGNQVYDLAEQPIAIYGPTQDADADFCAAIAP